MAIESSEVCIVREADRRRITGLSRTQFWRLEQKGLAPKRIRLSENSVGWLRHELEQWLLDKASERVGDA